MWLWLCHCRAVRGAQSHGPWCETLNTFAPPVRHESANMHAALVLRHHLGWMDNRECLVSSAPRLFPVEARYNVSRRCPQPSIGPLSALLPRCSHSRLLRGLPHHPLRGSSRVPHFPSSRRAPQIRPTSSLARSCPGRSVCLGPFGRSQTPLPLYTHSSHSCPSRPDLCLARVVPAA